MSEESQRVFLSTRLATKMKAYDPTLKIIYPNMPFPTPVNEVYGTMHILNGKSLNIGKSGDKIIVRTVGLMQVTFFSPDESGTKRATQAIDEIIRNFQNYQGRDLEGISYTFKPCNTLYQDPVAGWCQNLVRVPFHRDEYQVLVSDG